MLDATQEKYGWNLCTGYPDNCRDHMRRKFRNVAQLNNKIGQIRLVDASREAHVNVDDLKGDFSCSGK